MALRSAPPDDFKKCIKTTPQSQAERRQKVQRCLVAATVKRHPASAGYLRLASIGVPIFGFVRNAGT